MKLQWNIAEQVIIGGKPMYIHLFRTALYESGPHAGRIERALVRAFPAPEYEITRDETDDVVTAYPVENTSRRLPSR